MADLKEWHDRLLAEKPNEIDHDPKTCPVCATDAEGEPVSTKTYTEEEVRATVEAAVGESNRKLADLQASLEAQESEAEIETRITEAKTPLEAQIEELQTKLDAAVLEAQNEKARADTLEAEKLSAAEQATLEARKDERVNQVKEVANFPDEYLTENAERFAAMSDEDFAARLDEYKLISAKATTNGDGIPTTTVLTATSESGTSKSGLAISELSALRRSGVDPRTLA